MLRTLSFAVVVVSFVFILFAAKSADARFQSFKIYDLPAPDYPGRCLDEGIEGTVMLALKLKPTGQMERITVLHAPKDCPEFARAAVVAVKKARFYAPPKNHRVTEEVMMIPVNFTINE